MWWSHTDDREKKGVLRQSSSRNTTAVCVAFTAETITDNLVSVRVSHLSVVKEKRRRDCRGRNGRGSIFQQFVRPCARYLGLWGKVEDQASFLFFSFQLDLCRFQGYLAARCWLPLSATMSVLQFTRPLRQLVVLAWNKHTHTHSSIFIRSREKYLCA